MSLLNFFVTLTLSLNFPCLAEVFCEEIAEVYRNDEWRLKYEKAPRTKIDREVFDEVVERVSDLENMPDLAERS